MSVLWISLIKTLKLIFRVSNALIDNNGSHTLTLISACAYCFLAPQLSRELFLETLKKLKELTELMELLPISVDLALSLSIFLVLTGLRLRFRSSFYQRAIQTVPKSFLEKPNFGSSGASRAIFQAKQYRQNPRLSPHSIYSLFTVWNNRATMGLTSTQFSKARLMA